MVDGSQKSEEIVQCSGPEVQLGTWSINANAERQPL